MAPTAAMVNDLLSTLEAEDYNSVINYIQFLSDSRKKERVKKSVDTLAEIQNMFVEGAFNALSGVLSVIGGALGGYAGVHNTVFTKLLSQKGDLLRRIFIENVFTIGFKMIASFTKSNFME